MSAAAPLLDAHLHVWDLDRGGYGWLGPQWGPLHRTVGPDEAAAELTAAGVDAAVLVQADDSHADTDAILEVAAAHPWVHGVVGWVPFDDPDAVARRLDSLAGTPLVGVRNLVHDDPRDDFLDLASVRQSLADVAARGLPYDVCDAWPRYLEAVVRLCDALPELTVVVDHLAKPPRGTDAMDAWETTLRAVAARPNARAKISGLQRDGQPLTPQALRPVVDVALDAFGTQRLMYGSDWPMTLPDGGYGPTLDVLRRLLDELGADEQADVWHRTAAATYRRHDG